MVALALAFCVSLAAPSLGAAQDTPSPSGQAGQVVDSLALQDSLTASDSVPQGANSGQTPAAPIEVDPDGDGVPFMADFCPSTPPGARVGADGCEVSLWPRYAWGIGGLALLLLLFYVRRQRKLRRARRLQRRRMVQDAMRNAGTAADTFRFQAESNQPNAAEQPASGASPGTGAHPAYRPGPATPWPPATDRPLRPGSHAAHGVGAAADPEDLEAPPEAEPVPVPDPDEQMYQAPPPISPDVLFAGSTKNMSGLAKWNDQPLVFTGVPEEGDEEKRPRGYMSAVLLGTALFGVGVVAWAASTGSAAAPLRAGRPESSPPVVVRISASDETPVAPGTSVPARLILFGGDQQEGRRGRSLQERIAVRVEDAEGEPVEGVRILFEQTVGQGNVDPDTVATNAQGVAEARWTLGPRFPRQYVMARVEGFEQGPGVAFEASAISGAPTRLSVIAGEGQEGRPGQPLPQPVVFLVEDEDGLPVEGVPVRIELPEGQGAVEPSEAVSGPDGTVRALWTLADGGGDMRLSASLLDNADIEVVAEARADVPVVATRAGVVTGGTHSCAVSTAGSVSCWGGNASGQLGRQGGSATQPRQIELPTSFANLAAGLSHTCGVGVDGTVVCWGDNSDGQLGDGTRSTRPEPRPIDSEVRFRNASAGPRHTCAIARNSRAWCWGSNANGELGDGSTTPRPLPIPVAATVGFQSVSAGWSHTCGIGTDGLAYCWGRNAFGQLGNGSTGDGSTPTRVGAPGSFRQVAAGSAHTCGVADDGRGYCWGQNSYGQLGIGSVEPQPLPAVIAEGPWRALVVGGVHTCGLDTSGRAFCWGRNTYGQLGDGSNSDRDVPTPVAGDLSFRDIYASGAHTCGTATSGATYCWGYNVEGQLGDGTRINRNSPTRVGGAG